LLSLVLVIIPLAVSDSTVHQSVLCSTPRQHGFISHQASERLPNSSAHAPIFCTLPLRRVPCCPAFQVSTAHYERTIWGCAMCCQGSPICHSTGLVASGSTMSITPNVNLVGVVYVVSTCMPLEPDKVRMMQAIGRRWSYLRALAVALIDWWVTVPQMCCTTKCRSGPCCNRRIMHI
jgi:hypothetical protein